MEDELYFSSNIQFFDAMVQKIDHHQKVPIVCLMLLVLCNLNQINCGEVVKDVICQSVYGIFYIYRIRLGVGRKYLFVGCTYELMQIILTIL